MKSKKIEVSVIIKTFNEEENIARAIKSALQAIKGLSGEVIIADSLSTDRTIEIAKKYPVKIFQLVNEEDRSCGVGPQLGYEKAKGKFIYILDGDMKLNKKFIKKAIIEFKNDQLLAGVGGIIEEMNKSSIVFARRNKEKSRKVTAPTFVKSLMMGGIYKRKIIDGLEYFSNPNLHSYEESDLGHRIQIKGYRLKRIPVKMIKHYGDNKNSFFITLNRFKTKYLWGCGEMLRYHLFQPTFFEVIKEIKLYIFVLAWWLIFTILLFLDEPQDWLLYYILFTLVFLASFLVKKKNLKEFLFSLFSWNITALGLIFGLISGRKSINRIIKFKIIK